MLYNRQYAALRFISIYICFSLLLSCQDRRSSKAKHFSPPTLFNELAFLFKAGPQIATVISDTGLTSKQKQVFQKFMRKLKSDPKLEKEIDHLNLTSDSESLAWIKKIGFNREESAVLTSMSHAHPLIEKDTIIISKDNDGIHFTGSGTASILDSLVIYFNDSSASLKGAKLFQYNNCNVALSPGLLPKNEHLEKYYCFQGPNGIAGLLPMAIGDHYDLTLGRLNKSNRTYIYLKLSRINGTDPLSYPFYSIVVE